MKICIDTNTYEAFKRKNQEVVSMLEEAEEVIVPTIVLGELYSGFYIGNRTKKNIAELDLFLEIPGICDHGVSAEVAERYGMIVKDLYKNGTPIPTNDIWISAVAFETSSRVLTFDRHFDLVPGLPVIHPNH